YTDEGTHIEIARHLIDGEVEYLGITSSYLIAARLPLFEHMLGWWFRFVGVGMFQLRILTSLLGILTVVLCYHFARTATHDSRLALGALALLAVYPQSVIYSRFGFSYNLLPILILSGMWCLIRNHQTQKVQYLISGSLLFGLGTLVDFIGFSFLLSVVLIILFIRWQHVLIVILGLLLPFVAYSTIEIAQHAEIFIHD
ncbi:MAG: hypothetical protein CUN55_17450, partial [Phototrophicales bacterium]